MADIDARKLAGRPLGPVRRTQGMGKARLRESSHGASADRLSRPCACDLEFFDFFADLPGENLPATRAIGLVESLRRAKSEGDLPAKLAR